MVRLTWLCLLYSLPGPPKTTLDTGTYQLYPVNKKLCPDIDPSRDITFDLYTKANYYSPQILRIGNDSSVGDSNINFKDPTVIFLPGFLESSQSDDAIKIKNNYLEKGQYNIILVNTERLLAGPYYINSALNVEPIGQFSAGFVDFLVQMGMKLADLHVVGMSLGAQIAGTLGKTVKSGKLPRITGLDPAGPFFNSRSPNNRLSSGDADLVDIFHTNAGGFGIRYSIGDVDIWFNGGSFQPGCDPVTSLNRKPGSVAELVFCNHYQAWRLYVKTVVNPKEFLVVQCNNYIDFEKGKCNDNEKIYAGLNVNKTARGNFYITTGVTAVDV